MEANKIDSKWIKTTTVRKHFGNPEHTVAISEFIDPNSISRVLEPQSGNHLRATCRYKVTAVNLDTNRLETHEMTMEQLYDNHPWFFAKVRRR